MTTTIPPGTLLESRYRVERLLGEGTFARVYLARHVTLLSAHAVKVLNDEFAVQPEVRARFLSEGRIQAQLRHPHLVAVTDIVVDPPALVLEFIEGTPLDEWRPALGRPLVPDEVLSLMVPVLEAIGIVHGAGIVHRDIKPENIIVSRDSRGRLRPMVSDFGIAKVQEGSALISGKKKTEAGMRLGTPAYMSPEQVRGDADLGKASDVFALGVLLYELVAGQHPFLAANDFETMRNIVDGRSRPFPAPTPEPVARCVERALAREAANRFADCAEFRAALEQAFGDEPTQSGSGVFRIPEAVLAGRSPPSVPAPAPPPAPVQVPPTPPEPAPAAPPPVVSPPPSAVTRASVAPDASEAPLRTPRTLSPLVIVGGVVAAGLLAAVVMMVGVVAFSQRGSSSATPPLAPRPSVVAGDPSPAGPAGSAAAQTSGLAGLPAFVAVSPSRFIMGAPVGEAGRFKDEVEHPVVLTRAYALAAAEVTTGLWGRHMPAAPLPGRAADLPVEGVSWLEAITFCNALSAAVGRAPAYYVDGSVVRWSPDANGFRLPTEAEWEFAAGGQQAGPFAGGGAAAAVAWFVDTSGGAPRSGSLLAPNGLGLYDMSGNVGEWVWDRYGAYPAGEVADPEGPEAGETRVIRGGSYKDPERAVRVAYRKAALSDAKMLPVGVRLAVTGAGP